jgi:cytochrome c peroxidase
LFKEAYGHFDVTEDLVLEAIANFVNTMGSFNSKFDQNANQSILNFSNGVVFYGNTFDGFSAAENRGKALYNTHCASCHSGNMGRPVLNYANNGLDFDTASDEGVGAVTGSSLEKGTFKVPTLRNIAHSAPYMHDGRFNTLEDVLEHYNSGIKNHPNLSTDLKANGHPKKNYLSATDKTDIIAFLNTLSDDSFLGGEQFSNPFKQ